MTVCMYVCEYLISIDRGGPDGDIKYVNGKFEDRVECFVGSFEVGLCRLF